MLSRGPRTRPRAARVAAALAVVLAAAAGCSGDEPRPEPQASVTTMAPSTPMEFATVVKPGKLRGTMTRVGREQTVQQVADVVDGWIEEAWVAGPWPREVTGVWGAFTPGAARRAAADAAMTSGAGFGPQATDVRVTKRLLKVDLFARRLEPAGATVRLSVHLEVTPVDAPEEPRSVHLRGRVVLTPTEAGWKIFGHELVSGGWA